MDTLQQELQVTEPPSLGAENRAWKGSMHSNHRATSPAPTTGALKWGWSDGSPHENCDWFLKGGIRNPLWLLKAPGMHLVHRLPCRQITHIYIQIKINQAIRASSLDLNSKGEKW